mmetsp:Transcript_38659/g.47117  ORF Transcript_38659/g.47117 Transcript_38659/m.47117 type:complete len:205 (-) Transcript_38659:252-866(-)
MMSGQGKEYNKSNMKIEDDVSVQTAETADLTMVTGSLTAGSSNTYFSMVSMINSLPSLDNYSNLEIVQRSAGKKVQETLNFMTSHLYDAQIQVSSCELLARMSYDEFYRVLIASSGGILTVMNTMLFHPDVPTIQAIGCVFLANMCTNSFANRAQITAANGVKVIVDAMKNHHEPHVQSSAYFALQQLTLTTTQSSPPNVLGMT